MKVSRLTRDVRNVQRERSTMRSFCGYAVINCALAVTMVAGTSCTLGATLYRPKKNVPRPHHVAQIGSLITAVLRKQERIMEFI